MVLKSLFITIVLAQSSIANSTLLKDLQDINNKISSRVSDQVLMNQGEALVESLESLHELSDEADEEIEKFEELNLKFKSNQYKKSYFLTLNYMTFNTKPYLDRTSGSVVDLFSEEKGPCIGAGIKYQNTRHGFESGLCYAFLNATISEEETTGVNFNQNDVRVDALFLQSFYTYRLEQDTSVKIGIPLIYREADYADLDAGTVKDSQSMLFGYSFGMSWAIKQMSLDINMGSVPNYESSLWSLGISYNL